MPLLAAHGDATQHRVTGVNERRTGADEVQDVLRYPLQTDDASGQHRDGRRFDLYFFGPQTFGQKRFHLSQPRGVEPPRVGSIRWLLSHPRKLNPELVGKLIQRIDIHPAKRVQLLDRRRVRAPHGDPARFDLLSERTHD